MGPPNLTTTLLVSDNRNMMEDERAISISNAIYVRQRARLTLARPCAGKKNPRSVPTLTRPPSITCNN
jgi:hypothetical protein